MQSSAGSGSDTLVLKLSQDAWRGGAKFTVKVDGEQIGGTFAASSAHSSDDTDTVTLHGDWDAGSHKVEVTFLNDRWGGTSATDRNLYLEAASFNGEDLAGAELTFKSNGTKSFSFTDEAAETIPPMATESLTTAPEGAIKVAAGADLQALVDNAGEGAVFWLEPGVHRLQSVTPKAGQEFHGADGAIMNGAKLLTDFTQEGSHWVIDGQTQEGWVRAAEEAEEGFTAAGHPDAVFFNDSPLQQVGSLSELGSGKFYFDYGADKIYLADDPTGNKVEAATADYAFEGGESGVVIDNLVVEKYATPVQFGAIGGESLPVDWVIQNNEVRLNYGVGIVAGDGTQVSGNFVHDNGEMGLGGSGSGIVIDGNEISHNGFFSGINPYWEGGGTKFSETDGLVVSNNYSHDNNGYGLWTDIDNINTTYANNRVEYNSGSGINHEISYDAVIRDNSFVGNGEAGTPWLWGAAIQIQNSQNVEIYGNHVDMGSVGNGIALIQQDRGDGAYGEWITANNKVHDNVLIGTSGEMGNSGAVADYNEEAMLSSGNSFSNNQYDVGSASDAHWAWGEFYDWDTYRSVSGQDSGSALI